VAALKRMKKNASKLKSKVWIAYVHSPGRIEGDRRSVDRARRKTNAVRVQRRPQKGRRPRGRFGPSSRSLLPPVHPRLASHSTRGAVRRGLAKLACSLGRRPRRRVRCAHGRPRRRAWPAARFVRRGEGATSEEPCSRRRAETTPAGRGRLHALGRLISDAWLCAAGRALCYQAYPFASF